MATRNITNSDTCGGVLRSALYGNAAFCFLMGVGIVAATPAVTSFLGWSDATIGGVTAMTILHVVAVGLAIYAVFPLFAARNTPGNIAFAWVSIGLDLVWVIASYALVLSGVTPLSTAGGWAVAIVADIVFAFAVVQYVGVRRLQ